MTTLAKTSSTATPISIGPSAGQSKTRVVLVREPNSSRPAVSIEEPARLPMRLAIGVIVAMGVVGLLWLMGTVGYHLGFAARIGVTDLMTPPGGGLAVGIVIVRQIPSLIIAAGAAQTDWLMLGFLLIAVPAAGLSAARPLVPGAAPPPALVTVLGATGAVAAGLNALALVWWSSCGFRSNLLGELPTATHQVKDWTINLQTAAGLDAMALLIAALWVVLVMRLPIPRWLRALTASVCFGVLAVLITSMSISAGAATQAMSSRPLIVETDQSEAQKLVIGSTRDHLVTLDVIDDRVQLELTTPPASLNHTGTASIAEFLQEKIDSSKQ